MYLHFSPLDIWNSRYSNEALLGGGGGGGGGVSHPLSLKFHGQLFLIPKIIETVIPKITYLWNLTTGGNFKELSDPA